MLAGFSDDEILHELLVAPRQALIPLADTQIIERPGWWQLITPSLKRGGMNEVICSELKDADTVIAETIATYMKLDVRFRFIPYPGKSSIDLVARLERSGLSRWEGFAMAAATEEASAGSAAGAEERGDLAVEQVNAATLAEFTRVVAEGWQMDAAAVEPLHRQMLAHPARRHHLFLGRKEGVAVAAASYVATFRSAYLIGGVTLPQSRGRGLYRSLVGARLRHASARGLRLCTTLARATTSAPILSRLGFQQICALPVFTNF